MTAPWPAPEPPIFRLVGNTPLLEIVHLNPARERGVRVFAKLESRNPGGSVKDRAALSMIRAGIQMGALRPGKTLIDATSGNTGIAYAMLCAPLGIRVHLIMPANVSRERRAILAAYGAEIELTDPAEGQDGAIDRVRALVHEDPDPWFYPDQYSNPANPLAHERTTAVEILHDTGGTVTHWVAGLGTSGTLLGTARGLRSKIPSIRVIGVEPSGAFHGIEGLKHMATSHVPSIFHAEEVDERLAVRTEEALATRADLARREGMFVGTSSGAAAAAALDVAREARGGSVVVTLFPDGGERYVSAL
ncbi:MAG: PLP-dependent cysteine synthase family protein [Thermoplasmatota archaeon]